MLDLIFDRTAEDVEAGTEKGFYRYTDLNRVQAAAVYLRGRFAAAGYDTVPAVPLSGWSENDIPRRGRMDNYLRAVTVLHGLVPIPGSPALPASPDRLDWTGANALEKFLSMAEDSLDRMEAAAYFSGELFGGEV